MYFVSVQRGACIRKNYLYSYHGISLTQDLSIECQDKEQATNKLFEEIIINGLCLIRDLKRLPYV